MTGDDAEWGMGMGAGWCTAPASAGRAGEDDIIAGASMSGAGKYGSSKRAIGRGCTRLGGCA